MNNGYGLKYDQKIWQAIKDEIEGRLRYGVLGKKIKTQETEAAYFAVVFMRTNGDDSVRDNVYRRVGLAELELSADKLKAREAELVFLK